MWSKMAKYVVEKAKYVIVKKSENDPYAHQKLHFHI